MAKTIQLTEALLKRAKKIIERVPGREKVYITSDCQIFSAENEANGHASNLKHNKKSDEVVILTLAAIAALTAKPSADPATDPPTPPPSPKELSPLEIAKGLAADAARKLTTATQELEAGRGKVTAIENEIAALKPTDSDKKRKGAETRLANAKKKVDELETAQVAAQALADERAAKVEAMGTEGGDGEESATTEEE
jgi:hypothetical protein